MSSRGHIRRTNTILGCVITAVISYPIFQNAESDIIGAFFAFTFGIGVMGAIGGALMSDKELEE